MSKDNKPSPPPPPKPPKPPTIRLIKNGKDKPGNKHLTEKGLTEE